MSTRTCERCGKKMTDGMTDLVSFYCCEECFQDEMDELHGKGWWFTTPEEGANGGYYMAYDPYTKSYYDTGVFYTAW